ALVDASQHLGELTGVGGRDVAALEQQLAAARAELEKFGREGKTGTTSLVDGFGAVKAAISAVAASYLGLQAGRFLHGAIEEAAQAEESLTSVKTIVESTGGAAHRTAEQLQETSKALAEISVYDDDEILGKAAAGLLKFQTLSGTVFDRALRDT